MQRLLEPADYRRMPWRNGGGVTHEILVDPPGADLAGFRWRASIAQIASDGPFSIFAGVDRTLVLLQGDGTLLRWNGRTAKLDELFAVVELPGEAAVDCRLLAGPVRDFNVMMRRNAGIARVAIARGPSCASDDDADQRLVYAARGAVDCTAGTGARVMIAEHCTLAVDGEDARSVTLAPRNEEGVAIVVSIIGGVRS